MDIRPSRPVAATATAVKPSPKVPAAPAGSAALLHSRLSPSSNKVLDLRTTKPVKASATKPKTTPGHWSGTQREEELATIAHHQAAPPAPAPSAAAQERHSAFHDERFIRAKSYTKSKHISKFHAPAMHPHASTTIEAHDTPHHAVLTDPSHLPQLPRDTATQHQAMAKLAAIQQAGHTHDAGWRPNLHLAPKAGQYVAAAAAIAIMSGYIWLQNYPKMAIQSAGSKAGILASMPSYVPSSYTLAHTRTAPGIVTLDFTSPSQPGKLTIAQHRTTWDSVSLLDQYINGKSPDYTAIEGQGLTVYLYGQNQATWVNHGIWYNIEGATRLSRDQILKIAYSL